MHLAERFWNYFLRLSHKNKLTCELQNHRVLDLTSHPALDPCPVKLGREPKWRHLDVLWRGIKIQGFNQFKKCLRTCIIQKSSPLNLFFQLVLMLISSSSPFPYFSSLKSGFVSRRHFSVYIFTRKEPGTSCSSHLALLAWLPVNYRQLSWIAFTVWPCEW